MHITVKRAVSLYAALLPVFKENLSGKLISIDNASEIWKKSDNGEKECHQLAENFPIASKDTLLGYLREFGILPESYMPCDSEAIASTDGQLPNNETDASTSKP